MISAEQQARDILERAGVDYAQDFSADDLVEIANLIREIKRLKGEIDGRVNLLARKYARKGLTPEELARLTILDERVERLIPSVSEKEIDTLEGILRQIKEISAADDALRRELGIDE